MSRFWDEKFETNPGFDQVWDTETVSGDGDLDEDFLTSSVTGAPSNWGSRCLRVLEDSSSGVVRLQHAFPSSHAISYFRKVIIFKTKPTIATNFSNRALMEIYDSTNTLAYNLQLQRRDSLPDGHNFSAQVNDDGVLSPFVDSANGVALNTPYRLEVKYDATNDLWEMRIDGRNWASGSLTLTHSVNIQNFFRIGSTQGGTGGEWFVDNIAFDDADWLGPEPSGSGSLLSTTRNRLVIP
jgi:hypothetical protein